MNKRVTIKSIAQDLGISHMTVSRALSGHPNVNPETRKAIKQRALELGYVKSAAARAMRGDRTRIVGVLLPNIVNEFYARFADTLAKACEPKSYHLIIHLTNDDPASERLAIERLREVEAEAVIMVPTPGQSAGENLNLAGMKVIHLIRERTSPVPVASILVSDRAAIRDAVAHLGRQGHEAIAYIGADSGLSSGRGRLAAFREGLSIADLRENPDLIFTDAPSAEMGRRCGSQILRDGRATAIVCGGVEISNGALAAYMDALPLARPTAFVGYGDPSFYSWVLGGISTIRIPVEQLAFRAVEILDHGEPRQPVTETAEFGAELVVRKT